MHERSLMNSLLRQVEAIRDEQGATRVVSLKIKVGDFSGVEADLLESAFNELALGSPAEAAAFSVEKVPLKVKCVECGDESMISDFRFVCSSCESRRVAIIEGEEMILESVTLEGVEP